MWKKEDSKPQGSPESSTASRIPTGSYAVGPTAAREPAAAPRETPAVVPVSPRAGACISQGIRIKGEVTGSEDLFVDGQVEGKLNLTNGSLTVGPNGHVKADVTAREVIVRGRVEGKIDGRERIQLWSTGQVNGELQTERLAIEDGALLRGKVEAGKPMDNRSEVRSAGASSSVGKSALTVPVSSGTAAN
jgi:cytoskeletal protein CcmA (bactofilin family)